MKINDNFSNKNDFNYLNKFDFSKNDSFGLPIQNINSKNPKESNDNNNQTNIDPRLELTLTYLDINSTMPTFITNNISFNDILLLSKKDLIDLGFSLVERNRILHFSQEFKRYGKKYNIQEVENFFNEFQNLNMRINNNIQSLPPKQECENELNINNLNKRNNYDNFDNNYNYSFNNDNSISNTNNFINSNSNNVFNPDSKSYRMNNEKNNIKDNITFSIGNKRNKNNYNNNNSINNDNKIMNNYKDPNQVKNKNYKQNQNFQDFLNMDNKSACNNNYNDINSSNIIRQNSKASKNSSYSKNSKSRLVTISKTIVPSASSSESIVQKYQNLSEEIDNYFKKYNDYKEQKKNKMKKYQIITSSSNNSKKNYNPIYGNTSKISAKNNGKKKKNNHNNNIKSMNNINNPYDMNNFNDFNINQFDQKINSEFLSQKLQELQNKKKELKKKLNTVCDNENKKKMIIRYLEEEENK